jgi:hypothetical protein
LRLRQFRGRALGLGVALLLLAVFLFAPAAFSSVSANWGAGTKAPLPSGAASTNQFVGLSAVSCHTDGICLGAGNYNDISGHQQGLLLLLPHGATSWIPRTASLPTGAAASPGVFLTSASCTSFSVCAAAGSYIDSSNHQQGLLLTTVDGATFVGTKAALPNGATDPGVDMSSVSCSSPDMCVAVGQYFDSSRNLQSAPFTWSRLDGWSQGVEVQPPNAAPDPGATLSSVSCSSDGNCAAVGEYKDNSNDIQGLLLTESSGTWTASEVVLPPNADSNAGVSLLSVSCPSDGNCTAVGSYGSSNDPQGLLLTETSGSWGTGQQAVLPDDHGSPAGVSLNSVSCASAGNCSAVGTYFDNATPQANGQIVLLDETSGSWDTGGGEPPRQRRHEPELCDGDVRLLRLGGELQRGRHLSRRLRPPAGLAADRVLRDLAAGSRGGPPRGRPAGHPRRQEPEQRILAGARGIRD